MFLLQKEEESDGKKTQPQVCDQEIILTFKFRLFILEVKSGGKGGSTAASSKEDVGEELQEPGGAAAEGAGTLPADSVAAVLRGHAHSAG